MWRGAGRLPGLGPPRVLGRRRRRSCASACSGAPAASSPLRAQGQSPRSLQMPKRESESPGCGRAAAEAGAGARSLAPGGCSCCCCSGLNLPSRSRRLRRPVPLARCRRLRAARGDGARPPGRPEPLAPSARVAGAARRGGQNGGGGLGAGRGLCVSPRASSSLGKVYFRSASLCLWFHFLFQKCKCSEWILSPSQVRDPRSTDAEHRDAPDSAALRATGCGLQAAAALCRGDGGARAGTARAGDA